MVCSAAFLLHFREYTLFLLTRYVYTDDGLFLAVGSSPQCTQKTICAQYAANVQFIKVH